MKKTLFVLVSDSHLDPVTYQDAEDLRHDSVIGFQQGRQLAQKLNVGLVSAGDTVECNPRDYPRPEIIKFLSDELHELDQSGLPFWYINGNHDRAVDGVSLPEAINDRVARNIHRKLMELPGGAKMIGVDYVFHHQLASSIADAASLAEQGTLLLCHQRWKQFLNFDNSYDGSLADIPDKFEQVITGDLHSVRLIKVKSPTRNKPLQVLSPGATCKRTSAEPDEHFAWVVSHDGASFHFKRKQLKSRPVVYFQLDDLDAVDSLMDNYKIIFNRCQAKVVDHPVEIRKPLAFVSGKLAAETFEAIRDKLSSLFFVRKRGREARERSTVDTTRPSSFGELASDTKISVTEFVDELAKTKESASLVSQGIRADNKESFINSWEKAQGI